MGLPVLSRRGDSIGNGWVSMKTFNNWNRWNIIEGSKERKEEEEQLVHDLAMQMMKKNADRIGDILLDKLESEGIPGESEKDETDG